jgi:hypothetical protein
MPKRTEVIKKIEQAARARGLTFTLKRHGGNHDVYDLDGQMIPIERHRELQHGYAEKLYRQCQPKLGKGWWR